MNELERRASSLLEPSATSGWGIADAAIVGVVGYAALVLFLLLSMFVVHSIPSLHSLLRFYQVDSGVYALAGLVGGILFAAPLVMWFVRRRGVASLAESIHWECSNRTLGWAFLAGLVSGIAFSVATGPLTGRSYQAQPVGYIVAFMLRFYMMQNYAVKRHADLAEVFRAGRLPAPSETMRSSSAVEIMRRAPMFTAFIFPAAIKRRTVKVLTPNASAENRILRKFALISVPI